MEFKDIIITKMRHQKYINGKYNVWYDSTISINDVTLGKADLETAVTTTISGFSANTLSTFNSPFRFLFSRVIIVAHQLIE